MRTISAQAKDFREWMGWNSAQMASAVQRNHKTGKVSRQTIEQLEGNLQRRPRYISALAKTMGISVEDLEAGRWVRPDHPPGELVAAVVPDQVAARREARSRDGLSACLWTLAVAAKEIHDAGRRQSIANLVSLVLTSPDDNAEDQIPIIVRRLLGEPGHPNLPITVNEGR